MNFKGLIIFDLALLRLTELPVIAHDSNIFINIADLPIDKIMELYNQSEKQIFIAFDKEDTFYDVTRDIVHSTKIIELHKNGGELFGWSWAKKAAREKHIATETGRSARYKKIEKSQKQKCEKICIITYRITDECKGLGEDDSNS